MTFFKNWWKLIKGAKGFWQTIAAIFLGWFFCLFFTDKEKAKRVEKLEGVVRFCAGIISTMPDYCEMHPKEVEQFLYDEYAKITES
jgi:hypothetical protein